MFGYAATYFGDADAQFEPPNANLRFTLSASAVNRDQPASRRR
jgi:hypothetical protein